MRLGDVTLYCGLFVSGCAAPARPQPVPPTGPVAPDPAPEAAAVDAAGDVSDAAAERSGTDAAAPADAGPGDAVAEEAPAPAKRARFRCFVWTHDPQEATTDCFRSPWDCDYEREKRDAGARDLVPACKPADQAWCTKVGWNHVRKSKEHCFSSEARCDQYVSDVRSHNEVATDCSLR